MILSIDAENSFEHIQYKLIKTEHISFLGLLLQITTNLDGLKQQIFIITQFWRLEIQNKVVGREILSLEPLRETLPCLLAFGGCQQCFVFLG